MDGLQLPTTSLWEMVKQDKRHKLSNDKPLNYFYWKTIRINKFSQKKIATHTDHSPIERR